MRPLVLIAMLTTAPVLADDLPENVYQLAKVRQGMIRNLERLPDFACAASIQRELRAHPGDSFRQEDTVRFEVAHVGNQELFGWPGASKFEDRPITDYVRGGAIGFGDFALHATAVFQGGYSTIRFVGAQSGPRPTLRWDFEIPMFGSGWSLTSSAGSATVGSHGSFWADAATFDLVRLEVHADGIPPGFPLKDVIHTIDYERVTIGDSRVLLPRSATLWIEEFRGVVRRNITEFTHCRQYVGQSTISFDPPPASTPGLLPALRVIRIPAGLEVRLKLKSAIHSRSSAVGDPVEAVVTGDVMWEGQRLIRKGAIASGRIRRLGPNEGRTPTCEVAIDFREITMGDTRAPFFGRLRRLEISDRPSDMAGTHGFNGVSGGPLSSRGPKYRFESEPGVATVIMDGREIRLPKGFPMVWETLEPPSK